MDGAKAYYLYPTFKANAMHLKSRRLRGGHYITSVEALWEWSWVERPLVQILVVVASNQKGTLMAEVTKGFVWTAIGHELVDPKALGNSV